MLKQIKRILSYIATNVVIILLAYHAVIKGVDGAANILYFLIGGLLVLSIISLTPSILSKTAEGMTEPLATTLPAWANLTIDFVYVFFFIWHGWWWTGIAFCIASILWAIVLSSLRTLSQQNILDKLSAQP